MLICVVWSIRRDRSILVQTERDRAVSEQVLITEVRSLIGGNIHFLNIK